MLLLYQWYYHSIIVVIDSLRDYVDEYKNIPETNYDLLIFNCNNKNVITSIKKLY
jgi:hypothetical protein